jgi:catechol 2,3-dioxygenase-like lactoylglutathione lyase family enzyme
MTLANSRVIAVIPVNDLSEARQFYTDVLGLRVAQESPVEIVMECGEGTLLQIYTSPTGAGASHATIATWAVDDIDAAMTELRDKDVEFENYDSPGFKTEDGVLTDHEMGMKAAWFTDPDGNFLCLHQKI